jgi:mycoredoxin
LSDLYSTTPSQIVMYTTDHCSDCYQVKVFFDAHKINYLPVGLENNERATEFVININNGYRTVPTIIFPDGSILVEPSWAELREKFSSEHKTN